MKSSVTLAFTSLGAFQRDQDLFCLAGLQSNFRVTQFHGQKIGAHADGDGMCFHGIMPASSAR